MHVFVMTKIVQNVLAGVVLPDSYRERAPGPELEFVPALDPRNVRARRRKPGEAFAVSKY